MIKPVFQSFKALADSCNSKTRMQSLRDEMKSSNVDAFLVPRSDAHQGEYIQPGDARLRWLSGFSGSAGIAIILKNAAALFVDGRYIIQASNEVDEELFEIIPMSQSSVSEWLSSRLGTGKANINYDPWLHTIKQVETLKSELSNSINVKGGKNLIDKIWIKKSRPSIKKIYPMQDQLTGETHYEKISKIVDELKEQDLNHAIITLSDSISWLLNLRCDDIPHVPIVQSFAVINRDQSVDLFISGKKLSKSVLKHLGPKIRRHTKVKFKKFVKTLMGRILVDPSNCPILVHSQLNKRKTVVIYGTDPCLLPKSIKNKVEIEGSKQAHLLDGTAMTKFLYWFSKSSKNKDLDEITIVKALEKKRRNSDLLKDISFDTICGSGPNGAIVHYRVSETSNRLLQKNDLILIDSGGQYESGTTDITRTLGLGEPTQFMKVTFTLVLKGLISLSRLKWPKGLSGKDIDGFARAELWRAGFDYDHGTGHGIGAYLSVHEGPQGISRNNTVELKPGMIVSIEPGYYKTNLFGIRIENLVLVKEAVIPTGGEKAMLSFETLTICPIDKGLILSALLTADERSWLNKYHLNVFKMLSPTLDEKTRSWLNLMCSPI